MNRRIFLMNLTTFAALPLVSRRLWADEETSGWKNVLNDQGVAVWNRYDSGRALPVFKGISTIDAGLFELLAVLDDTARHTEWIFNCSAARIIKQINEFDRLVYNRTAAPWPVSDRDVVLSASVEASMVRKEVVSRFSSIESGLQPKVDGVVRMPRLRGFWRFTFVDERRTRVTYQIDADPGGALPDFIVERASRKLPLETINGMRKQVVRTRGKYAAFLQKYDPSAGGKIPEQFLK